MVSKRIRDAARIAAVGLVAVTASLHEVDVRADVGGASIVVSRELCNGLWMVPLTWSGRSREHALTAVFDTGATELLIDPDALARVAGQQVPEGRRVSMDGVAASTLPFTTFRPRVHEMSHLGAALGKDFDVFLPFPAFEGRLLVLDYPAEEMRIETGSLPEPDGVEVFSSVGPDERPWLEIDFPDRSRRVLIDSGSNGRIELKRLYGLEWQSEPVFTHVSTRMDKYVMRRAGRVAQGITIANIAFQQPILSITRDTELLGVEVLQHFVLTFDAALDRVRFEPVAAGPLRMPSMRGTGAVFRADPDGYFEIEHVQPGSPAARADLEPGDRIVERDGRPVQARGCRPLNAPLRATESFGIQREGRIETLELPTIDILP